MPGRMIKAGAARIIGPARRLREQIHFGLVAFQTLFLNLRLPFRSIRMFFEQGNDLSQGLPIAGFEFFVSDDAGDHMPGAIPGVDKRRTEQACCENEDESEGEAVASVIIEWNHCLHRLLRVSRARVVRK